MLRYFLAPPRERLTAEGRFEPVSPGGPGGRWRRPQVLLARELCSFQRFDTPSGTGAGAAASAARLHARVAAPYLNSGFLVRRSGKGFCLWWWDLDRVDPWLAERFGAARVQVAPEPLVQPEGLDWRIVRQTHGFEAQYWRHGALFASTWRRRPFDVEAWSAFARVQRQPVTPAPSTPPQPQTLPASANLGFGLGGWRDMTPVEWGLAGAVAAAAALALMASFFAGQGLRLGALAHTAEIEAAHERAATRSPTAAVDTAALRRLAALHALSARPDPMTALATAMEVLRFHGVAPTSFTVDADGLTLALPYAAIERIDRICRDVEASGAFSQVRPMADPDNNAINLVLVLKTPPSPVANPGG